MKKVKDVDELKTLSGRDGCDFTLILNDGTESSKHISWDKETERFFVYHAMDGRSVTFTEKQFVRSTIYEGIKRGALYFEG
jgi:hypothetical protein